MRDLISYKETYSFDAELTDSDGRKLPIDCKVGLPSNWGDKADIEVAVPHSAMPFEVFKNPCKLHSHFGENAFRFEMNDLWYRNLTSSVYPSRMHGSAPVTLTHISGMRVVEELVQSKSEFRIYISSPDFLNDSAFWSRRQDMLEELSAFRCPKLGLIRFQRYWVLVGLKDTEGFLSRAGYALEISQSGGRLNVEEILNLSIPVLNIMSVFFRQKIMVLGWEVIDSGKRERYWQYPLEPSRTAYVSVEPKLYMVNLHSLADRMEAALGAYYDLNEQKRKFVDQLSYSLRPASKIGDGEWFMAMFRELEFIAGKSASPQALSEGERHAVDQLRLLADAFAKSSSRVAARITGFANKVEGGIPPVTQNICSLFQKYGVRSSDLWEVSGSKGLVEIRNKLAHRGADRIHRQGLAVATFHLSLLNERLAHSILGLEILGNEFHSGGDQWLHRVYVESLKKCLFDSAK